MFEDDRLVAGDLFSLAQALSGAWRARVGEPQPVYIEKTGSVPATFPNRMVNGRKHGAWEEIFPNGTKFRGEYITGLPERPATLRFPDGTRQTRNFKNDNPI